MIKLLYISCLFANSKYDRKQKQNSAMVPPLRHSAKMVKQFVFVEIVVIEFCSNCCEFALHYFKYEIINLIKGVYFMFEHASTTGT